MIAKSRLAASALVAGLLVALPAGASTLTPQGVRLERAVANVNAASDALDQAKKALERGREVRSEDWIGNQKGGARLRRDYYDRVAALELEVNRAQAKLDRAYEERNAAR